MNSAHEKLECNCPICVERDLERDLRADAERRAALNLELAMRWKAVAMSLAERRQ